MGLANHQKQEFRHNMAKRLIEAGLISGKDIKESIEVLEDFIFLQEKTEIQVVCKAEEQQALAKHIKSFWGNTNS